MPRRLNQLMFPPIGILMALAMGAHDRVTGSLVYVHAGEQTGSPSIPENDL